MNKRILSDSFSSRRNAVAALWAASKDEPSSHDLKQVAADLESTSVLISNGTVASAYAALAALIRVVEALTQWRQAVLAAQPEADRFLRSARERFKLWSQEYAQASAITGLAAAAGPISALDTLEAIPAVVSAIALVPLPIAVFEAHRLPPYVPPADARVLPEPLVDLTVAFLKFQFDGRPAVEVQHLSPGEVHDLEIEVRVSRWPEGQEALILTPLSVEPRSTYDFPSFRFERPGGTAPYTLHQRGRAVLHLPQGMHARPFEFKYSAEFSSKQEEQPVAVVGHRTLLIEGTDVSRFQVCGYPGLDRKLFEIRDQLRRRSGIPQSETADAILLLGTLCNLAGRAVQDAEFRGSISEAEFQKQVRAELRRNPQIGAALDEHPQAAGGITDLALRGIPIELKVEPTLLRSTEGCDKYLAQTASYAVAKSKNTSVLCVLDTSAKSTAPLPPEALLELRQHADTDTTVCVLVIQGNLARPSALSR
jgi:hypothetical protein